MNERHNILLVDDSDDDLFLLRRAFRKAEFNSPLAEVHNGQEAIAYLAGEGIYADRRKYPLPSVMILDLNMPMKNGFEVLGWVCTQPALRRILIIVMTASMRPEDVERAFELRANTFLVKPSNIEDLANMLHVMSEWMRLNHFPPKNDIVVK